MKKDIVKITCYGTTETMERKEAIKKYREGVDYCDGYERERYMNVLLDLLDGKKYCYDERY